MATKRKKAKRFQAYSFESRRDPNLRRSLDAEADGAKARSCLRKVRYKSEHVAKVHGVRSQEKAHTPIHIYECRYCQGFHLTSKPQWGRAGGRLGPEEARV